MSTWAISKHGTKEPVVLGKRHVSPISQPSSVLPQIYQKPINKRRFLTASALKATRVEERV